MPYSPPSPEEAGEFQEKVLEPLLFALQNLAFYAKNSLGSLSPSHLHYLTSEVHQILGDKDVEPAWPVLYPPTQFETNLLDRKSVV